MSEVTVLWHERPVHKEQLQLPNIRM
jgi:hypothetical protein